MTNDYPATLYEDAFDLVYPQVKNENKGVLYKVIHILIEGEESEADQIYTHTGINKNASLNEDESIAYNQLLMEQPNAFNQILKKKNWLTQKMHDITLNNLNDPDMATVAWLVFIGSLFVGLLYCKKYVNSRKQNQRGNARNLQLDSFVSQSLPPITAALCLVVPASVIFDLRNTHQNALEDNSLSCSDVKMLIDNSSHFLCIKIEDVHSIEQDLKVTEQEITNDSNQEVYVRIHITNGRDIIGKEVPYTLKRDLPPDGQRIVERYKCLKNLSGLEKFHHI